MLSQRIARFTRTPRSIRAIAGVRYYNPEHKGDPLYQSHKSGLDTKQSEDSTPVDAANRGARKQADRSDLSGNPEGVGFAEQVGSQSTSRLNFFNHTGKQESSEGKTGQEDITPPAFGDVLKKKLGLGTTAAEDKQNRGGGKGVTGTGQVTFDRGQKRGLHSSATLMLAHTRGQASEASQQPKENTHLEQNPHLKHKKDTKKSDSGKGNAADEPHLSSQHFQTDASWKPRSSSSPTKRTFSTSARVLAQDEAPETEHTAESYFKEVDDDTKPANPKVHQVDGSATGAPVMRANEGPATGEFSRAGSQTEEYETVSKQNQPYDTPPSQGPEADQKLRYGNVPGMGKPSGPEEGPEGESKGGRQPEGR